MTVRAWLFVVAGVVSLDARMLPPILPAIAASLSVSAGQAGLAVTAYAVPYGLMQLFYGPLSDRYGRIRIIRSTALLFAIGTVLSGLAETLWGFVGARLLTGIFAAATIPTTFAYIGDTVHYEERQKIVGRLATVFSSGQAISAALAGVVSHFVSWRVLFGLYAVVTLGIVAAMRGMRDLPRASTPEQVSYMEILRLDRARRVFIAVFIEGALLLGGNTYMGVLASQRYGWNDLQLGLLIACYGIGNIAGGLWIGRLTRVLGEQRLAWWGGIGQAIGFGLLAMPVPWPLFAVGLAVIGLGQAGLHSTLLTRATELLPSARGKAFSLFPFGFFLGGSVGTAVLGRLVDGGLIALAMAASGLGLAAIGLYVSRKS